MIEENLGLLPENRKHHVAGCSALQGKGLYEGLDWICQAIQENKGDNTTAASKDDYRMADVSDQSDDESGIDKLDFSPTTENEGNLMLANFTVIKHGTECPFAKSAILGAVLPFQRESL